MVSLYDNDLREPDAQEEAQLNWGGESDIEKILADGELTFGEIQQRTGASDGQMDLLGARVNGRVGDLVPEQSRTNRTGWQECRICHELSPTLDRGGRCTMCEP